MSISQNFPATWPSLTLDFANSKTLDPRVTFTRGSTGTYVGADGLVKTAVADQARFDHDPATGESLGLLIEESRTNLLQYSIPDNTNWENNVSSLSINNSTSPDGTNNASLFTGTQTNTSAHFILRNQSVVSGTVYTQTFFVKAGTTEFVQIAPSTGFNSRYANFQLTGEGVVGNYDTPVPPTIQRYPNGWYRIRVTETAASTTTTGRMALVSIDSLTSARIPFSEPRTFYVWGAQLEAGSFPTSYIPTSGSAVTRTQDNAKIEGTNFEEFFNPNEGTIYSKAIGSPQTTTTTNTGTGYPYIYSIDSSQSNRLVGSRSAGANNGSWSVYAQPPSSFSYVISSNFNTQQVSHKIGGSYTSSSYISFADGVVGSSITPGTDNNALLRFRIGSGTDGGFWGGTIAQIIYYPERLTNSQLQNLTK